MQSSDQPTRFYCVLDFEATCWNPQDDKPHEIIEFPSVLLRYDSATRTLREVARFQRFVKPVKFPVLSEFCTLLTGITNADVEDGDTLENAIKEHHKWVYSNLFHDPSVKRCQVMMVTFGDWDLLTCLPKDAEAKHVTVPGLYKKWINLKKTFKRLHESYTDSMSLPKLLEFYGKELEGRLHSGIDDCHNTARLFQFMLAEGFPIEAFETQIMQL